MQILLTGVAGSLGIKITIRLLEEGHEVIGVDVLNDETASIKEKHDRLSLIHRIAEKHHSSFEFHKLDISSPKLLELFKSSKPDKIIHAAARVRDRVSVLQPAEFINSNILGTANLLDCVRQCSSIKHIVFLSTRSVVGWADDPLQQMDENTPERPYNPYGVSKGCGEKLFFTFYHNFGVPTTVLRLNPQVCDRRDMMPRILVDGIMKQKIIQKHENGSATRDWMHPEDTVTAVMKALNKPLGYEIFLLGNGKATSLDKLIDTVEKVIGVQGRYNLIPNPPGDVIHSGVSNSDKAERLLGWQATQPLEQAIQDLYIQLKSQH